MDFGRTSHGAFHSATKKRRFCEMAIEHTIKCLVFLVLFFSASIPTDTHSTSSYGGARRMQLITGKIKNRRQESQNERALGEG